MVRSSGPAACRPLGHCPPGGTTSPKSAARRRLHHTLDTVRAPTPRHRPCVRLRRSLCATLRILDDFPNSLTDFPDVRPPRCRPLRQRFRSREPGSRLLGASGARLNAATGYAAGRAGSAWHVAAVLDELPGRRPWIPRRHHARYTVLWHNEFGTTATTPHTRTSRSSPRRQPHPSLGATPRAPPI